MTSEALTVLKQMISGGGIDFSADVPTLREKFNGMLESLPVDDEAVITLRRVGAIPGCWVTARAAGVILYLHGGAYVAGTAHGYRGFAARIASRVGASAFVPGYRLAPEHPFPAAVSDSLAAYEGLLGLGYPSSQIAVVGDSAGGGLAVALLLAVKRSGLPQPTCAVSLSPWADLGITGASVEAKAGEDRSLSRAGLNAAACAYLPGAESAAEPEASPIYGDLQGLPPLSVHVGSAEILLDDAVRLARTAGLDQVAAQLKIWPEMVHDWGLFSFMLPEGEQLIQEVAAFIGSHLKAAVAAR